MKKILFSTILGVTVTGAATASIVSRGFFEEAMENYATNTALDLKADNADLTALSEIVGTPAEITFKTYKDIFFENGVIAELFGYSSSASFPDTTFPANNLYELINLNYTNSDFPGLASVVDAMFYPLNETDSWPIRLGEIFGDYERLYSSAILEDHEPASSFFMLLYEGGELLGQTVLPLSKLTEEVAKIGTLPTEYETVGAALSAIKGIAEEAKQLAQQAIPDPKTEGINGKYVLTVDIVGDNATYTWEKIDRTTGETSPTE